MNTQAIAGKRKLVEIVITRTFNAPRERVWKAWTEPTEVRRWWGPKGFTAPFAKNDLRVGGKYHYLMRGPDGKDYWSTGVHREIEPLSRIVSTDSFSDKEGKVVPATYYGMDADLPLEMLVTVTFQERVGKTTLTLRHSGFPEGEHLENALEGWNHSLDKLEEYLEKSCPG
jgi:uncharacterized protein YndB with AHSA1/START domain